MSAKDLEMLRKTLSTECAQFRRNWPVHSALWERLAGEHPAEKPCKYWCLLNGQTSDVRAKLLLGMNLPSNSILLIRAPSAHQSPPIHTRISSLHTEVSSHCIRVPFFSPQSNLFTNKAFKSYPHLQHQGGTRSRFGLKQDFHPLLNAYPGSQAPY